MTAKLPARKSRSSRKHLATDFDWEGLRGLDHNSFKLPVTDDLLSGLGETKGATAKPVPKQPSPHTTQPFAFPPPGDDPVLDLRPKTTDASGVKPKPEPTDQQKSSPTRSALSDPRGELQRLQLLKQTQELEIRKLELQLELAKITSVSSQSTKPSISDDISSKSMGDLKTPQKTRFPQPWPHIFTPGEPQLYSELSLPAFVQVTLPFFSSTQIR